MRIDIKICGVRDPETIAVAASCGARYVGFVFYPRSPRAVPVEAAKQLARTVPTAVRSVGLFVDPSDHELDEVVGQVPLDLIQLHGSETPNRVAEIKAMTGMPVMKAVKIADAEDVDGAMAFAEVADRLLFDARPPKNVAALPGGNGIPFDWTLLAGRTWPLPWMLSGGLSAETVAEAVRVSGATAVDVSSGVEVRPGVKDAARIRAFADAVAAASVPS